MSSSQHFQYRYTLPAYSWIDLHYSTSYLFQWQLLIQFRFTMVVLWESPFTFMYSDWRKIQKSYIISWLWISSYQILYSEYAYNSDSSSEYKSEASHFDFDELQDKMPSTYCLLFSIKVLYVFNRIPSIIFLQVSLMILRMMMLNGKCVQLEKT